MSRELISSGSAWEGKVGYSRAVKVGSYVHISGTTATDDDGNVVGKADPGVQTEFILRKLEAVLPEAGASLQHVVRTRIFVTDIAQWEAVGLAHGQFFGDIRPANTMVEVSRLIDPDHMVEIEMDAYVG